MVVIKNGSKRKFLLREKWKIISIIKVSLVIFKSVKLLKNQKYHWNVIIWNILFTFPSTKYFNLVYFWGLNFQLLWYIAPKWLFFIFGFWILPIIRGWKEPKISLDSLAYMYLSLRLCLDIFCSNLHCMSGRAHLGLNHV